jgi:DHA2 family multidrug resistance protein
MGNAAGIFNLLRNLGGSFGVAFSSTVLAQRTQVHQTFLVEHVTSYNPAFEVQMQGIRQWLAGGSGAAVNDTEALTVIYREVLRQAGMLAFNDTFWVLAVITAVLVLFTPIFKRSARTALPMEGMH